MTCIRAVHGAVRRRVIFEGAARLHGDVLVFEDEEVVVVVPERVGPHLIAAGRVLQRARDVVVKVATRQIPTVANVRTFLQI